MVKKNLQLILQDQYKIKRRIIELGINEAHSLKEAISNQNIIRGILDDMHQYIMMLAEELNQIPG